MVPWLGDETKWGCFERGSLTFLVSICMLEKPIKFVNLNPWKKNIGDCSIRAICAAIGMRYELVCKELGVSWKKGHGLVRDTGIDLELIKKKFDPWFDIVESYYDELPPELADDPAFTRAQMIDLALGVDEDTAGVTLAEFLDLYRGQGTFLVGLEGNPDAKNPNARKGGHIVCARCWRGQEPYAIDSWRSEEMKVDAFMRVKKTVPRDDPRHWVYDYENKCFAGYGLERKKNS